MSPEEADELRALAERLIGLTGAQGEGLMFAKPPQEEPLVDLLSDQVARYSDDCLLRAARSELERRKLRKRFLPTEWFAEGAWNIMIDLFENEQSGTEVCVTSACIAAEVPATTALRNIAQLIESGMVQKLPDPKDQRRAFLRLSHKGSRVMRDVLSSMVDSEIAILARLRAGSEKAQ